MTPVAPEPSARTWVLVGLAAIAALPSLGGGFVYDDVLLIVENPLVHSLARSAEIWQSSYWPAGGLFRPLPVQLFAAQWALGGGAPVVFHGVSLVLNGLATLLVYRLVQRILLQHRTGSPNPLGSWAPALAAAVFAVHPVHVEAFANLVGQSELLAAIGALVAVERYLAWRTAGALTAPRRWGLAGLTLLTILSKETGYMVPLLLAAAELTVVRAERRDRVGSAFVLQGAAVAVGLLWRVNVLGILAGDQPSAAFEGMDAVTRAIAMLAVVPQWARLLLWPSQLQAEYGPPGLPVVSTPGLAHLLGLAMLLGSVGLVWFARKRHPDLAFAVLWVLLALVPVSNVLAPTGVVLAERTLYLPSVGLVLALASTLARSGRLLAPRPLLWKGAVLAGAGLLTAALVTSVRRQQVWRSQERFFAQLVRDAPLSYRAHLVASRFLYGERRWSEAEEAGQQALRLYSRDPRVHEQLGRVLRVQQRCGEAIPILEQGLQLEPSRTTVRSRLIECALAVGDTGRARAAAEEAVRAGQTEFRTTLTRLSR